MRAGTYGLTTSMRGPASMPGGGLAMQGVNEEAQATDMLGKAASMETQRGIQNTQAAATAKAGGQQLGSTIGTMAAAGAGLGPWGMLAGGLLGALAGDSLF